MTCNVDKMYSPVSDKNARYRDRAAAHLSINQIAGSRSTFGGSRRCDARDSHGLFPTSDFPRIASIMPNYRLQRSLSLRTVTRSGVELRSRS
ncbi:hypothetical protein PUN28_005264 [Cardiocondyla obscurior]|uniref:Uncharacterized protein n=1 Tax=Cardiocondyla obscurior TaxID=286306 RepID=A0AAW2GKX3_9HYME